MIQLSTPLAKSSRPSGIRNTVYSDPAGGIYASVHLSFGCNGMSAGLVFSPTEARELGAALLMHADRLDPPVMKEAA